MNPSETGVKCSVLRFSTPVPQPRDHSKKDRQVQEKGCLGQEEAALGGWPSSFRRTGLHGLIGEAVPETRLGRGKRKGRDCFP